MSVRRFSMAVVLPKCHRRCGQFYGVDVVIYVISCITLNDYCEYNVTVTDYLLLQKKFMHVLNRTNGDAGKVATTNCGSRNLSLVV